MTSAIIALQEAAVARLNECGLFSGVYHDAPARAQYPYAVLNGSDERDWGCKARQAREITLQLTLWDEQPSRLLTRESDVEGALMPLSTGTEWYLSTFVLTGKRRSRNPGGPWSCTFEFRARLVKQDNGAAA